MNLKWFLLAVIALLAVLEVLGACKLAGEYDDWQEEQTRRMIERESNEKS